jgi:hypothetical protein
MHVLDLRMKYIVQDVYKKNVVMEIKKEMIIVIYVLLKDYKMHL